MIRKGWRERKVKIRGLSENLTGVRASLGPTGGPTSPTRLGSGSKRIRIESYVSYLE